MSEAQRNAAWAATLVDGLCRAGDLRHAVVSPGSRSTPLVLALASQEPLVNTHIILDERSAAFFALGLARSSGRPTLLVCTSGSAGGHWLPALIEASESGIPLIAITADRPSELQECGAPQTTRQGALFGAHIRWQRDLGCPHPSIAPHWLRTVAAQACDAATGANPGPVHLNVSFRKPLWAPSDSVEVPGEPALVMRGQPTLSESQLKILAAELQATERGVIVVGPHATLKREPVLALSKALAWPIIADPASQLRFGVEPCDHVFGSADALCRAGWRPEGALSLRLGRVPTSKALNAWLAGFPALLVNAAGRWHDPDHVATRLVVADEGELCGQLAKRVQRAAGPWLEHWRGAERVARSVLAQGSTAGPWGGVIARALVAELPEGATLVLASSMAIRDVDAFAPVTARAFRVVANRGVNGIDGTLATALGEAHGGSGAPTVLLCGDLAFLHDVGTLNLVAELRRPVTMVLVDNAGGGIFDHLPVAQHPRQDVFERYFIAPAAQDIRGFSEGLKGLRYHRCDTLSGLSPKLQSSLERPGFDLIHVPVSRTVDLAEHNATWERLATALEGLR